MSSPASGILTRVCAVVLAVVGGQVRCLAAEHPRFQKAHFAGRIGEMSLASAGGSQLYRMNDAVLGPDTLWSVMKANWQKGDRFPYAQSATLELRYYPEPGDAPKLYAHLAERMGLTRLAPRIASDAEQRLVGSQLLPDRQELMSHRRGQGYSGARRILKPPYVLTIMAGGQFASDEAFVAVFDEIERNAYATIRKAGGRLEDKPLEVAIRHVHPFDRDFGPQRRPGDVIVEVTDADGRPAAGRDVILHLPDDTPDRPIFGLGPLVPLRAAAGALPGNVDRGNWTRLTTDANGRARMNYLKGPSVLYHWNLSLALDSQWHRGQVPRVKRTIEALVLDAPLAEAHRDGIAAEAVATAKVELVYDCVARIYEVGTRSSIDTPEPRVQVAHKYFADVNRLPAGVLDEPFPLRGEDEIRLYRDARVGVQWLNNLDMWVEAKRSHLVDSEYATITICPTRPSLLRWLDMKMDRNWMGLCFTGAGIYLSMVSNPYATAIGGALGVVSFVWSEASERWDPLSIELKSHLALSLGETAEAWALEGEIRLDDRAGGAVALPAGRMTRLAAGAGPQPAEPYKQSALPAEVQELAAAQARGLRSAAGTTSAGPAGGGRRTRHGRVWVWVGVGLVAVVAALAGGWLLWRRRAG